MSGVGMGGGSACKRESPRAAGRGLSVGPLALPSGHYAIFFYGRPQPKSQQMLGDNIFLQKVVFELT